MGITEVITAPRSPWQNPYAERLIVRSAATVWITLSSSMNVTWAAYCRAIFNIIMTRERIFRSTRTVHGLVLYSYPSTGNNIIAFPEVGGLHHRYERRAA